MANLVLHGILALAAKTLRPNSRRVNAQSEEALALREYAKHGGSGRDHVVLGQAEVGGCKLPQPLTVAPVCVCQSAFESDACMHAARLSSCGA